MKAHLFAAAAFAALSVAAIAASPAVAGTTAELRFGDLDLGTDAGRVELARRIDVAAAEVCRPEAVTGSRIVRSSQTDQCKADLQRQVEARIALRKSAESRGR